ncbi:host attachment protein [Uliginosibacterium sp. H1]|uniref:host attachment protein n=1 Tax=Uliginosibacterium sp. H1 TaxID=3114757 RepID=UPI002E18151B|nr:host attachment protein [Uliginosibacterium sp. H1]
MSITWILVANARRARLFANHGPNKGLELVQEAKAAEDLVMHPADGRASPRREGKPPSARSFAHQLAGELQLGRSRNRFARAILVAPPGFMGLLNAELDHPTEKLVSTRVDKDYTRTPTRELTSDLSHCLCA